MAVLSPYIPEGITAKTTVLIPIPDWVEAEGVYTSLDGAETVYRKRVLDPPAGVRPAGETLLGLLRLGGAESGPKDMGEAAKQAAEEIRKGRWS